MTTFTIYGYTAHRDAKPLADYDRIKSDGLPAACAEAAKRWPGRVTCAYAGSHFDMPREYWGAVEAYGQNPPPWPETRSDTEEVDREPRRSIRCDADELENGPIN
mgnify:CR=1 FL=1